MKQNLVVAILAFSAFASSASAGGKGPATVDVVRDGEPAAVVVVANDASAAVKEAGKLLVDLLEQSTGAKLRIAAASEANLVAIYVGDHPQIAAFKADRIKLGDDDGFDIAFPGKNSVVILGRTETGTVFGVHEFLERYVGVRWLMPGPMGTDVPKHRTLAVPAENVRQSPSFSSRQLVTEYRIGTPGGVARIWAHHNRSQTHLLGQAHNLNRLFQWEADRKDHPTFFPITQKGARFRPIGPQGWQPCFDPAVTAETATQRIVDHFDKRPTAQSYSLSVNDNSNYCRCRHCAPKLKGANYSNAYYPWVNAVVEGVAKQHPDKLFGVLAYNNVAWPPDCALHPNVVPFMTEDRMKWAHPKLREQGEELTRKWHVKCPTLAWYDYLYGSAYLLPRVYPRQMAETLRFGHKNGVRHYYAETGPHFGEGPKLYVALKLLWNVDCDVDAVSKEWCDRVGGPDSGPYLSQYFAFWEAFWTKRVVASKWFRHSGTYLPIFSDPTYLLEVTERELAQCRMQMEAALAKTKTPEQKGRVRTLYDAFEFYEASALAYQAGTPRPIANQKDALECFDRIARIAEYGKKRTHLAMTVFPKDPALAMSGGARVRRFAEDRGVFDALSAGYSWAVKNPDRADAFLKRYRDLEMTPKSDLADLAKVVRIVVDDPKKVVERVKNGDFEEKAVRDPKAKPGEAPRTPQWGKWVAEYARGTDVRLTDAEAQSGTQSVKFLKGHASLLQNIAVKPGETYVASIHLNGRVEEAGGAKMVVQWMDEKGKWMFNSTPAATLEIQPGETTDGWVKRSSTLIRVPPGVAILVVNVGLRSSDPDDYLFIDDISVKQVILD